jgi:hypothetical protein
MKEQTRIKMQDPMYEQNKRDAKRMVKERGIKYTEALRIVKASRDIPETVEHAKSIVEKLEKN